MSTNLRITYLRDDTIRVQAVIKDFDSVLIDPDSNTVIVYDPVGTNMGTIPASKAGTGTYTADYAIPADGTAGVWRLSWKALNGTWPARESINFLVGED